MESLVGLLPLILMIAIIRLAIRWQRKKTQTEPLGPNGEHPYGIRSWLALFIFICFTFGPLLNIGTTFRGFSEVETQNPDFLNNGAWQIYKIISWTVVVILIAWQVWLGYTLKAKLEPRSVFAAKVFLVGSVVFSAGTDMIALFVLFRAGPGVENYLALIKPALSAAIWFTYFSRSKRVKNTYRL